MVTTFGLTHVAGEPYLFATDPDGYEIEIWFERPTPLDPPARRH